MSYACANVIYGVPFTEELHNCADENGIVLKDLRGANELYGAGGDFTPGYIGIRLGMFDETDEYEKIETSAIHSFGGSFTSTPLNPTIGQTKEVVNMLQALPEELREALEPVGVYIVWSSS